MKTWLLLAAGLAAALVALFVLVRGSDPGPVSEEIDGASRARLEKLLEEDGPEERTR